MKYFTQSIVGDPERGDGHDRDGVPGDCWRTVIACMTDAENLEDVPHFIGEFDDYWWIETQNYIRRVYGDDYVLEWWGNVSDALLPAPMIATGPSPRGDFAHAVIIRQDGKLIHDPHPSGVGITEIEAVFQIIHRREG